jgi:hypothetical protein
MAFATSLNTADERGKWNISIMENPDSSSGFIWVIADVTELRN